MNLLDKLHLLENEATAFGFKWENPHQIMVQIRSEVEEVNAHIKDKNKLKLEEEIGDLLHAVFSLSIFCGLEPHTTLSKSITKFEHRFKAVQQLAYEQGLKNLNGKSFNELMEFWDKAKQHSNEEKLS